MEKVLLIDGSSLLHRAFYALPLLSTRNGEYTNGVFGFIRMLNKTIADVKPDYLVICFDKSRVTFRNQIAQDYKGHRKETPSELRCQFQLIKEVLEAMSIPWLELDDYEADDLLGTFDKAAEKSGFDTLIYSGDRDVLQLVDENTTIYLTKKGISNLEAWDENTVKEKYGLTPKQLIDLKGLMGDSSDNISGVPGVGEKTALKLLEQFGSIEELFDNLDKVANAKLREKLNANRELAETSKKLATICINAPIDINWSDFSLKEPDYSKLKEVYQRLEFKGLLKEIEDKTGTKAKVPLDAPWPPSDKVVDVVEEELRLYDLNDNKNFETCLKKIMEEKSFAISLKWQGRAIDGGIESFAIAFCEDEAYTMITDKEDIEKSILPFKDILEDNNIKKLMAGCKEAYLLLAAHGIKLNGVTEDIYLAAYLLDPSKSTYSTEGLALNRGINTKTALGIEAVVGVEAALISILYKMLHQEISELQMGPLYENIELPLAKVLAGMELAGIRIEKDKLREIAENLSITLETLTQDIYKLAGQEFNINSSKQLGEILFDKMMIPPIKKTKTGYSTDAEVLDQLAGGYEIAAKLQDYRSYSKLKSTYTESLAALINPRTGKLHTSFNQTVTNTGRLSSTEPNLQNIPIRLELGRRIREVFVPEALGNLLVSGDYNQIELRILAHMSGDERLIKAFIDGEDIHTRTAAEVFGVDLKDVDSSMRRQAKAVNFGIVYGISDYGLGRDLGISRAQAGEYIKKYFARYPKVQEYQKETIAKGKKDGYVSTLLGRRRYLPELNNRNFNLRSFAERMAINTPIQGSAADIIKIAMVKIDRVLKEKGLRSKMILQVHDELMFDVVNVEKDQLVLLIKQLMEEAFPISVPLTVDMKVGKDWYNMQKV